jgi:hypothetical protein
MTDLYIRRESQPMALARIGQPSERDVGQFQRSQARRQRQE